MNPWEADAFAISQLYNRGATSPLEVVDALARRIESSDHHIGSFRNLLLDDALDRAKAQMDEPRTSKRSKEGLRGIPVAIKEIVDVAGLETPYGSKLFEGRLPDEDAQLVRRLKEAGALIVGNTRSHEFAWGITTQNAQLGGTRNPWDIEKIPGGSSGGSAAAVASGFCPIAIGTDTGGSVRIPAGFCGVMSLKPSFDAVSMDGILPLAYTLDHPGILARSAFDLKMVWDVISSVGSGRETIAPPPAVADVTFGILPELHDPPLGADHDRIFQHFCELLQRSGHQLRGLELGEVHLLEWFGAIQGCEALHVHTRILRTFPTRAREYGNDVRGRLEKARGINAQAYIDALRSAVELRRRVATLFEEVDVIVLPLSAAGPSPVDDPDFTSLGGARIAFRDVVMGYTVLQNLCGLPVCTVPAGFDSEGIPVGIQLTGPKGSESLLLSVVRSLEEMISVGIAPIPVVGRNTPQTEERTNEPDHGG